MKLIVDEREHATVLAALRFWQEHKMWLVWAHPISTNDGEFEPLNEVEIDDLCMRINTEYIDG